MNLIKKVGILIFSLLTAFLMYQFRTVPSGKLWECYTVIYVPVETDEQFIIDGFNQFEIEEYVCLQKQRVPLMFLKNSVEKTLFTLNINNQNSEYLNLRENYFYDSAKQYKLFYVPNDYKENVNLLIKKLNKEGIAAGIDSSFSYPFVLPVFVLLIALILLLFSKKKSIYFPTLIFPLVFSLTNPFYSCSICGIFILLIFFMITNLWQRTGAVKKILHSIDFYLFSIMALILPFANSWLSGVFALMTVLVNAGFLYCIKMKQDGIIKNQAYTFLMIRNARQISIYAGKLKQVSIISTLAVICVFGYFVLNSTASFNGQFAKVLLPGESNIVSKNLSNLDDYAKWTWNIKTLPYKSINKNENENKVSYPEYKIQDGQIKKIDIVQNYNQEYKNEIIESIDNLDFYSIEQVLKSQGTEKKFGYTASSSYSVNIFTIIMMIISVCVLLFIDFSAIIKKGGKK